MVCGGAQTVCRVQRSVGANRVLDVHHHQSGHDLLLDLFDSALLGDMVYASGPLTSIYMLAVLLPNLAVAVRRLHDTGRSGWYLLMLLIPFVGLLLFLILMAQDSHPGDNRYGADPKHRTAG